jgi:peptidoglycan hydrolase CwlO-like protein
MKPRRLIPLVRIASSAICAVLLASLTAAAQSPPGTPAGQAAPSNPALGQLEQQVQELGSALQAMRAEITEARSEATALKQELGQTRAELLALKGDVASAREGKQVSSTSEPAPSQAGETTEQRTQSRVSKIEEAQQLLSSEVSDQDQSKVESGSKYRVRLSGLALFNAFTTRGATDNFDLPDYATARDPGMPNASTGATLRQSILGLDVFGPEIAGAKTQADIGIDFFGGFPQTPNGVTSGLVRLRTAGVRLDWQNTSLVIGQYGPFFSPLSPTSLASVAYPALAASGNLWQWTPQAYIEHRINTSDGSTVTLQGGIMDPLAGEVPSGSPYRVPGPGESSGQPAYAARVAWGQGTQNNLLSFGVGGYYARQNWGFDRIINAWAGTADWSIPVSRWFSLTGEFYTGRAIGGLGAAEGQSVAFNGESGYSETAVHPSRSTGGWTQLKFLPVAKLEFNGAFGEDFSTPANLQYVTQDGSYPGPLIGRNQSAFVNGIYHLRSNIMFSAEYRRLRTAQSQPGIFTANQVSLSAATLF